MTTPNDWNVDEHSDAPYLPAARPVTTAPAPAPAPLPPPPGSVLPDAPSAPDAPYVPAPTPVAQAPSKPIPFDAKAMVESQKRFNANPAYGALPTGTEASREAAQKLRDEAQKKRRRNRLLGRAVVILLLAGVAAAGWFGYQAYQDQQDRDAAERAAAADDDLDAAGAAAALTPLGEQQEIIEGMDVLNDTARSSSGGLVGAVDDAREVVGDMNDDGDGAAADSSTTSGATPTPFTYDVVVPTIVRTNGERLPDASGRETYVIDADEFAQGDPEGFALFVRLMEIQPQLVPEASAFADLPTVDADQIIISVVRTGDRIDRAIVVGESVALRVDVTPSTSP